MEDLTMKYDFYKGMLINSDEEIEIETDLPDICPACSKYIHPSYLNGYAIEIAESLGTVFVFLYCPACRTGFIKTIEKAKIDKSAKNKDGWITRYSQVKTSEIILAPKLFNPRNFSEEIQDLSPSFVSIYNQSLSAEVNDLDEVAGMGYRKSLEFLVKDYLVGFLYKDQPEIEVKIKKDTLGNCIKDYIQDERIKKTARKATWLGNDQTHYIKKFECKDIGDLKVLIDLVVHYIEMEFTFQSMENDPDFDKSKSK